MAIEILEGVGIALESLRANKLRSFLTVLGVIIGIAAIMGMISIIEGLNQSMRAQLASLGTDVLYVRPFQPGAWVGGIPDSLRHRKWFKPEDAEAIRRNCPAVEAVAPLNFTQARLEHGESRTRLTFVIGTTPDYTLTNNYAVETGRNFTDVEVEHRAPVCVLGPDQIETLFPHGNAVGKTITIGGRPYTVVGEAEPRGKLLGMSLDDIVLVPYTSLDKSFGPNLPMVMNAKPSRSRSRNSGVTRMPSTPQTIASPLRTSRSFRQIARPSSITITPSIRCRSTSSHAPRCRTDVCWLVVE
jgi:putative ABC transport system permease protein